jgi:hypothetical protein
LISTGRSCGDFLLPFLKNLQQKEKIMNTGIPLDELARQLMHVEENKKDFVAPTTRLSLQDGRTLVMNDQSFAMSDLAHNQIAARLNIPRDYYRKMQDKAPELLDRNVNTWFGMQPERRFIRTYDGKVRAFLSDRYKPKENASVAKVLLPALLERKGEIEIMSSSLTEMHMYVKAVSKKLEGEIKVGQVVRGGISVRNSEVGCGAFDVSLFVLVLACMNGMIREHSMKSYHVGKRLEIGDDEEIGFYSPEAIEADSKAFMLKVRDTVNHAFNKGKFDEEIARFRIAAENPMNIRVVNDTIEDVTKRFGIAQHEGNDILSRLMVGNDFTQWGLANAVTNLANDVKDYERSTELEKIGGKIIDLNPSEWRIMNKAA